MTKSDSKQHQATLAELQQALKHIHAATKITTCALCLRDLTLAESLIENLASVIGEVIEEGEKEGD